MIGVESKLETNKTTEIILHKQNWSQLETVGATILLLLKPNLLYY